MQKIYPKLIYLLTLIPLAFACSPEEKVEEAQPKAAEATLFELASPAQSGITFQNKLIEGLNTNVLMYEYFYNGGGVAIGDLNGDDLDDIYFTGNMSPNKLYLNRGNMRFEDITEATSTAGRPGPWKTGVTMADVNGDGLLDIYVCYSGNLSPEKRKNELYINEGPDQNGLPKFSEQAETYGIASTATSTQGVFFDYDRDGDLDLFLLNHNPKSLPILDEASTAAIMKMEDPAGSQLFRNDSGRFIEVTKKAGIHNSALSYGLGAAMADINGDGWTDIYVGNDYTAPDYLYMNNGDGTFSDKLDQSMGHTSHFSMGNDIADINNDALPDIITLDMLPEENRRQKLLMAPDNYEKFDFKVKAGFNHQYMRNMLQVNNGNETFSEIGQLSGISNTDWSWSAQFADFDNDGWKDLYITNGYLRDYTNMDFLKFMGDYVQNNDGNIRRQNVLDLVKQIPASNLHNYIFSNNGDLTFTNASQKWGLDHASNSNGAAYADLDNDGDLDLVVNNINQDAFLFVNQSSRLFENNFLKVQLKGENHNTYGLGAKISLYHKGQIQYLEQMPTRGYQSSVSPVLHFGLGSISAIDSLQILWPSGKAQTLTKIKANQTLTLEEGKSGKIPPPENRQAAPIFEEAIPLVSVSLTSNTINDFKRQPLMVSPISFGSPTLTKADLNGDGLEDLFVGGGVGDLSKIFIQQASGKFNQLPQPAFEGTESLEVTSAEIADFNGDGFPDLYIGNGGYGNFMPEDPMLQDQLFLNDGKGKLTLSSTALPSMLTSTSSVAAADINKDGNMDLFVGSRVIPGRYPEIPRSYLLINDGQGKFHDQTSSISPELQFPGLITDAKWADLNQDGNMELIITGEWMPILVYTLQNGKLVNVSASYFEEELSGWWNRLYISDLNADGFPEIIAGNLGENSQIHASATEPAQMVYKDFDDNGSVDPILLCYIQGKKYPYLTRDELLDQITRMRSRFPSYESFADAQLEDVFTEEELKGAKTLTANHLQTSLFINNTKGKFTPAKLPIEVQSSPIAAIYGQDFDLDGHMDLLMAGNMSKARLRFGKSDANYGLLLLGDGKGGFTSSPQTLSGLNLKGDIRSILNLNNQILFGINQQGIKAYKIK
ncbi:hypothetical protein GCM10007049_32140 [Echinicola pacifica]|uniref:ASPIC/UnbV domain-containing protein n=1 Tax=Echinicola pacifica TaxID=346377 RepID=A0A918Q7R1_9BACT|nr:VCBS repeat-containing protein [Echinicola pacifica]GGZ36348.1 hypothetical protein GCM10007049_32140 [Echinicola pacifica]